VQNPDILVGPIVPNSCVEGVDIVTEYQRHSALSKIFAERTVDIARQLVRVSGEFINFL